MNAKIEHDNKLKAAAEKVAEGGTLNVILPAVTAKNEKIKPAKVKLFEELLEEAKVTRSRKSEREAKKTNKTKEVPV